MKKVITVVILITMVFNIMSTDIVYADDLAMYRHGLIQFAATLAAYGITIVNYTNEQVVSLYDEFLSGLSPSAKSQYYLDALAANRNMLINATVDAVSMGLELNGWIKNTFSNGYSTVKFYNGDAILDSNPFVDGHQITHNYTYNLGASFSFYKNGFGASVKIGSQVGLYNTIVQFSDGQVFTLYTSAAYIGRTDAYIKITKSVSGIVSILVMNLSDMKSVNIPYSVIPNPTYEDLLDIRLSVDTYCPPIVDTPADDYPSKKRELGFPLPPLGFPNLDTLPDDAGVVYNGSIEDFLDDVVGNPDYVDTILDTIVGSLPIADPIDAPIIVPSPPPGIITWPKNPSIPWPGNPPIVTPAPSIPSTPEEGIGNIDASLTGLLTWLSNWFAAPSATLNFSPLMGINIKEKFPFSLPFDLAGIFTSLEASAEPPEWVLKWGTSKTGTVDIPISFEQFEPWARIVRWGVLVIFIIGLIVVTRNMIGG